MENIAGSNECILDPWYTALCRQLVKWWGQGSPFPRLRASWRTPPNCDSFQYEVLFVFRLPLDPEDRGDPVQLQRLRESIELFSLLAMTDNAVFVELMENYMDSQSRNQFWSPSRTRKSAYCQPTWEFWFEGTLSHRGVTSSMKSPVTWGSLLGFPDDPWNIPKRFGGPYNSWKRWELMEQAESVCWVHPRCDGSVSPGLSDLGPADTL